MDEFSDDCKYAVFDDIQGGFEYFHSYKGWLGAQKTIRHHGQVPKEANDLLGQTLNHVHERGPTLR